LTLINAVPYPIDKLIFTLLLSSSSRNDIYPLVIKPDHKYQENLKQTLAKCPVLFYCKMWFDFSYSVKYYHKRGIPTH
jgi:hypothetical protein